MGMRIFLLLGLSAALLSACGPAPIERPREGAQVGVDGRSPARADRATPPPTLSPYAAAGGAPLLNVLGQTALHAAQPTASSPSPSPSPSYVIVATDGAGANVRAGPSTAAPIITTLKEGTLVEVLGDPVSAEGRSWRQIRSSSQEGWVVSVVVRQR